MGDNIRMITEHLSEMIDVYEASDIDYALGLVTFRVLLVRQFGSNRLQGKNRIDFWQLTKDWKRYKKILKELDTIGGQNAYDAIYEAIYKIRFRQKSQKHFILVTDEPFSSAVGLNFDRILAECKEFGIKVNVLGISEPRQELLALKTGGSWQQIPSAPRPSQPQRLIRQGRYRLGQR
jgi:hypothetical protein